MATKLAKLIVAVVLDDLHGRRGIGDELAGIKDEYPDVYSEMKAKLAKKVDAALNDREGALP